ncbi:MAG: Hpt domain-containing protein [Lachnospiraceae bacterium]
MNEILEKLEKYGADVTGAMGRFLDDEDLYQTCFVVFLKDESFQKLGEAIAKKEYEKSFEYAHTLKGVAGNMGLTPMYQVLCDMVEDLRKEEYSNLSEYYKEVMNQLRILEQWA